MKNPFAGGNAAWDFVTVLLALGSLLLIFGAVFRNGALDNIIFPIVLLITAIGTFSGVREVIRQHKLANPMGEPRAPIWRIVLLVASLVVAIASPWWISFVIH